jgi:hypothetical protein
MKYTKELSKRHNEADKLIKQLADEKLKGAVCKPIYIKVGAKLGISEQTVANYVKRGGADGYLKDAIIEELRKIKKVVYE